MKKAGFAIAWLLVVTALLCMPGSQFPKIDWQSKLWLDKWIHLFLFLVLVILWCKTLLHKPGRRDHRKIFILLTISSILYGFVLEIIQHYFIPFRSFDYGDLIADAAGAFAGYFISVRRFNQKD